MKGNYYANVFVHYEVIGSKSEDGELYFDDDARHSQEAGLPPYIIPGTAWHAEWCKENPDGWKFFTKLNPRNAAYFGHIDKLRLVAKLNKTRLYEKDDAGYQPIHEAARTGQLDIVKFLLRNGADIGALTDTKLTPLQLAIDSLGKSHPVSVLLRRSDAHDVGSSARSGNEL
jgi:hypothetical protein